MKTPSPHFSLTSAFFSIVALSSLSAIPIARADRVEFFARGEEGRRIEFGTGADGAFSNGPVQTGISIAGATITIDTDVKATFEFTSFLLSAGNTLNVTGSRSLNLRVLGTTTIQGTLTANGGTGGNAAAAAPTATGGTAGAGGGQGGIGGERSPNVSAGIGSPPSGTYAAGGGVRANDVAMTTQYSGGGGCHGNDPSYAATDGIHPTDLSAGGAAGACSLSQATIADHFEFVFASTNPGGAGGGGGSTQALLANGINGAGGGGGGGAIHLSSRGDLTLSGSIQARGGAGGVGALGMAGAGDYGSSGGGGSGGSIWIQTAGTLLGAGTLDVSGGAGGSDTSSIGGDGSRGAIRLDAGRDSFGGTFTPSGTADQSYLVLPATTEFTLSAGPACGITRSNPEENLSSFLLWSGLILLYHSLRRLLRHSPRRSRRRSVWEFLSDRSPS